MSIEYKKTYKVLDISKINKTEEFIEVEQFYMNFFPKIRCRKFCDAYYNMGYTMSVKIKLKDRTIQKDSIMTKEEYNYCKDNSYSKILNKRRYGATVEGMPCLFDEYYGEIDLQILAIEFADEDEMNNFVCPYYLEETSEIQISPEDLKR